MIEKKKNKNSFNVCNDFYVLVNVSTLNKIDKITKKNGTRKIKGHGTKKKNRRRFDIFPQRGANQ